MISDLPQSAREHAERFLESAMMLDALRARGVGRPDPTYTLLLGRVGASGIRLGLATPPGHELWTAAMRYVASAGLQLEGRAHASTALLFVNFALNHGSSVFDAAFQHELNRCAVACTFPDAAPSDWGLD